ncbi:tRNA threonylcarbamoyladenosine biosynthesis protein TsaB [Candidatus Chromulinivorax destructor]|uniref:Gcp-like domain-containing protein n=1 Tax=Candidatus Chromulinivorax destructor TaxID=2066483 RepID=A0A345ZBG5_9BACT|nr:hypothetical protein [Candidatus Chromulinivorax destructor]AXK60632.1 hypothetical protein C0J27_02645 [Candidatus Chromulinivorax destructor]
MSYIITIQYPYQYLEVSIACNSITLETVVVPKIQAVGLIIPTLAQLLTNHGLILSDIACIGINTGPGPFNTLRAIIATANGISFAQKTPLIDCNGLELLLQENKQEHQVAILDAFGNDVYFAIKSSGQQGYTSICNLVEMLNNTYKNQSLLFVGNGSVKHQLYISQKFAGNAHIDQELLFASSTALLNQTYKKYRENNTATEIFPLYFQSPVTKS